MSGTATTHETPWQALLHAKQAALAAAGQVPSALLEHAALQAVATIAALAASGMRAELVPGTAAARLTFDTPPGDHAMAGELLAMAEQVIARTVAHEPGHMVPPIAAWAHRHGLTGFIVALIQAGQEGEPATTAMLAVAAAATADLQSLIQAIALRHREQLVARDAPDLVSASYHASSKIGWVLAPEIAWPARDTAVRRRVAALAAYGAVESALRTAPVTAAVDQDDGVEAALAAAVGGVSVQDIAAVRGARSLAATLDGYSDCCAVLRDLAAHEVPYDEWPEAGAHGWPGSSSCWQANRRERLFRADFATQAGTRTFLEGVAKDLLQPLIVERARARHGAALPERVRQFAATADLERPWHAEDFGRYAADETAARRRYLRWLRLAVIGRRTAAGFEAEIAAWSVRDGLASVLRLGAVEEGTAWPALCPPWTSDDGQAAITEPTDGIALHDAAIEAGRALTADDYQACRQGQHVLALRVAGRRTALLRASVDLGAAAPVPEVALMATDACRDLDGEQHGALQVWLGDLLAGRCPMPVRTLRAYRRSVRYWHPACLGRRELGAAHACRAYPLYRDLLAGAGDVEGIPGDWTEWCERTGLTAAVDEMLALLAPAADPLPAAPPPAQASLGLDGA